MQKQTRKIVKSVIDDIKKAIKNREPKILLKNNPNFLIDQQNRNKNEIDQKLSRLRDQYTELLPFVKEIKKHIKDITEETHICAVYLSLCFAFLNWNSLFLLAEYGENLAAQSLIRVIRESLGLAELFAIEFSEKKEKYLNKWYSGKIIVHRIGREKRSKYFNKYLPHLYLDTEKLEAQLYQIESQVIHSSYEPILECISPFTEEFDFEEHAGFHRTNFEILEYAKHIMNLTNTTLQFVYLLLLKDKGALKKLIEYY